MTGMADSLHDAKRRLRDQFLGRHGIHAIGVSQARNCVRLYVEPARRDEVERMIPQLSEQAAPFGVLVEASDPATGPRPLPKDPT
jgi:hypothetical protein